MNVSNNEHKMTTLIYAGAGYDEEVMNILKYDKYIFYDTLPKFSHYEEGQPGWIHTKTPDRFSQILKVS